MTRLEQKDSFSLRAHELAVRRLREDPSRAEEAIGVIERWREQAGGKSRCDRYWDEWETLLREGVDAVERALCRQSDRAATLRSTSPLGRFLSVAERYRLWREVRSTP